MARVAMGVLNSWAVPAARLPRDRTQSWRRLCSRAAARAWSRSRTAAVMRATNQTVTPTDTKNVSHMPAKCSRIARASLAIDSGQWNCHRPE